MATEAKNTNYWISSSALYIQLNAMGEPDYIQCSVVSGASILCYMQGIPGLEYDAGHNYQRWPLAAYPSVFPDSERKYIYVAIPRTSTADNNTAVVVYPSERIDLYGYSIANPDKLVGDKDFYYIYLQGIISEVRTDADGKTRKRDWLQHVDCGKLNTDESLSSGIDGTWWKYNSVTDTITFFKTILSATFDTLTAKVAKITKLFLGGSELNGVADDSSLETDNTKVVTPLYLGQFGVKHFLAKDKDDVAHGTITFEKVQKFLAGLNVGDFNLENGGSWTLDAEGRSHLITDYLDGKQRIRVSDKFVFDVEKDFCFDAEGNIVAHSIVSENANADEEKGFILAAKDEETGKYKLCIDELLAWGQATVKQLHVKGDSIFDGNLFSKLFISDFLTGKGWGIYNKPIINAAGVQENKWTGEFDNVIVRGSLRVYEMIISQLLGENDNRVFTGMMEVDHYDPETGKVYLDTQDGKLYNPFRRNDIIMVQRFNGMPNSSNDYYVTKNYELLVTDAGCGSLEDGDKRLDWVTFTNFASSMADASPETLIKKKDTFVRVDNLTDPDRKGIMQIITVGTATPHLDVIYGLKTDPEGALKGRLGNLEGVVHPWFGRLQGFGEYLNNLYAVGDFVLRRTGESVDTKFQVLENMFSTRFAKTSYELTNGQNYLENGQFLEQITDAETPIIDSWEINTDDETMFWVDATGMPFMVNSMLTTSGNKKVTLEQNDGRQMLRIQNCGLRQKNAIIKQPGTHKEYVKGSGEKNDAGLSQTETSTIDVQDKLYVNVRIYAKTAGQLAYGFEGCKAVDGKENTLTAKTESIAYSGEWQTVKMEGKWNGTGDFIIRYSGDCYIALVTITDEPLSEFSKTVSTQIIQTAENIKLLGENIDNVNGKTTKLGFELDTEKGEIRQYVQKVDKDNRDYTTSQITQTANDITSTVEANKKDADGNFKSVRTSIKQNADSITSTAERVDGHDTSISQIRQDVTSITQTVGQAATQEQLKANVNTLNKSIRDNLDAAKSYANGVDTGIRNDYASAITIVQQKKDSWSVASGMFDANGNLTNAGITSITPTVTSIANTRFDKNWGAIKSGYVATADFAALQSTVGSHTAQIGTRITKDDANNLIAEAVIQADKISLTGHTMAFTGDQITINTNNFKLDKSGNVSVKGEINATSGSIGGFAINKYAIGSVGEVAGMGLSNEYLSFMNQAYTQGEGYFITCGSYLKTGLRIFSTISPSNDLSTGMLIHIDAGTSTPSDPISGGKMCTALDLRTRWADQAGSFDVTNPYEGNHAIVIRGGDVIGLRPSFVRIAKNYSLSEYNHTIECYNTSAITLFLPSSPLHGQHYTIIQRGGRVNFSSSKPIYDTHNASTATTWYSGSRGQVSWIWYNGSQWIVSYATI